MKRQILFCLLLLCSINVFAAKPKLPSIVNCDLTNSLDTKIGIQNADRLQACISSAASGGIIELPPGSYPIQKVIVFDKPLTLRTKITAQNSTCGQTSNSSDVCAHLIAVSPVQNIQRAFIQILAPHVTLQQIYIDGNKSSRINSPEATACRAGDNGKGMNIHVQAAAFSFLSSTTANALCGTGLEVAPPALTLRIENSRAENNGFHNNQMLWSDGFTILQSDSATISRNYFVGNTDVDLIFGGCTNCQIVNNNISHVDDFVQSSFAALMIHAWPNANTSGNYTGTIMSGNNINCGNFRCGFGILVGAKPWYNAPTFGGLITHNSVAGAQAGFIINDATGTVQIGTNQVQNSGGKFKTSSGVKLLPAMGISQLSLANIQFIEGAEKMNWTQSINLSGSIANWWK